MLRRTATNLFDARESARRALSLVQTVPFDLLLGDIQPYAAMKMSLVRVGSSLAAIEGEEPEIFALLPKAEALARYGESLVSDYDRVVPLEVLRTAKEDLPPLLPVLDGLIARAEREGL